MIAVFAILIFVVYLSFFFPVEAKQKKEEVKSPKYTAQMRKLWQVAQTSMKERKPFRAEKALLTILKFDEKNAAAYNRLGILYAKDQRYSEAVECFEIAQSLDNNPASIHNAGLIYLETGEYEKAEMAFLQAIQLEGDVPARYIALAKAEEKLGSTKKAIEALENAYELDPSVSTLRQILAIYEATGDTEAATALAARIEEQIVKDNAAKRKRTTSRLAAEARRRLPMRKGQKATGKVVNDKTASSKTISSNKNVVSNKPTTVVLATSKSATPTTTVKATSPARPSISGIARKKMRKRI